MGYLLPHFTTTSLAAIPNRVSMAAGTVLGALGRFSPILQGTPTCTRCLLSSAGRSDRRLIFPGRILLSLLVAIVTGHFIISLFMVSSAAVTGHTFPVGRDAVRVNESRLRPINAITSKSNFFDLSQDPVRL